MRKIRDFVSTADFLEMKREGRFSFALRTLDVGDAIEVAASRYDSVRSMAHHLGKRMGREFRTKKRGDKCYVWRES